MIDASLIQAIAKLALDSQTVRVIKDPAVPPGISLYDVGGKIDERVNGPRPVRMELEDVHSLGAFIGPGTEVYVGEDNVIAVKRETLWQDRARVEFSWATQFQRLCEIDDPKSPTTFTQKAIVRFLDVEMFGANGEQYASLFRQINFQTNDKAEAEIGRQKVSIGKKLESEVSGASTIPESLTFAVDVFETSTMRSMGIEKQEIKVLVEVDPLNRSFALLPLAGEVEKARTTVRAKILEYLIAIYGDEGEQSQPDGDESMGVKFLLGSPGKLVD